MKFFRGLALAVALLLPVATIGASHADTTKSNTKSHSKTTQAKSDKKTKSTKKAKSTKKTKKAKKAKKAKAAKKNKSAKSVKKSATRSALKPGSKAHGKKHGKRHGHPENSRKRNPALDQCVAPTPEPTDSPTVEPTDLPTVEPTDLPTDFPTDDPTVVPYLEPTDEPTPDVTDLPTPDPTMYPVDPVCPEPTEEPSPEPTIIIDPILCAPYDVDPGEVRAYWHNKMCYPIDPIVETPELAALHNAVQAEHEAYNATVYAAQVSFNNAIQAKYQELIAALGDNPTYASYVILKLSLTQTSNQLQRDLQVAIAEADKAQAEAIGAALAAYDEQTSSENALGFRQIFRAAVAQANADLAAARQAQQTAVQDATEKAFASMLELLTVDSTDDEVQTVLSAGFDALNAALQTIEGDFKPAQDAYELAMSSAKESFLANSGETALPQGPERVVHYFGKPDRCDGYPPVQSDGSAKRINKRKHHR